MNELETREKAVLSVLKANNLALIDAKGEYRKESLSFLGHRISSAGMSIDEMRVKAITGMRPPRTRSELRSFLGLVNFVGSYLESFSDLTKERWGLTTAEEFKWITESRAAFDEVKSRVAECTSTRGFFSDTDVAMLCADASPTAVGAVLVQMDKKGDKRVISFASKTLTKTQQTYTQVHREAFGIVWAVEHFDYYLRGRKLQIFTDDGGVAHIFSREADWSKRVISRAQVLNFG